MEPSILKSIKKLLGIDPEYTEFDTDILTHINTFFSVLHNVGAAPVDGFYITDDSATWADFIGDKEHIQMVRTYIYLRVRLVFDPPSTSYAIEALKKQYEELEWRLNSLELTFNPYAYGQPHNAFVWEINPEEGAPLDSEAGDLAIDPSTGDVWMLV